ncbi:MAG: Ig-like domain-containing protein [Gemmatimonadota bacterium]
MTTSQQRMEIRDRRAKRVGAAVVVACGFLVATCDHSTGPEVQTPAAIEATQGANATVAVAGDVTLAARVKDAKGSAVSGVAVQWSIVSGGGTLSAASTTTDDAGTARVTWTVGTTAGAGQARASVSGVSSSASFPVTLTPGPATTVTLSVDTARFTALDDTATVTATADDAYGNDAGGTIAWAVDDAAVATVSAGLVTAVGPGETFATATSGAAVDTLVVVVAQEPVGVTVSPAADTVASGATQAFSADAADANGHGIAAATFTWTSSDTMVAVVDTLGVAMGRGVGTAYITAATGALSDSAAVTVTAGAAASVSVSPGTLDFAALDDTARVAAVAQDGWGNPVAGVSVTWSTTAPAVATVDGSGLVTAVANGSAGVMATAGGLADTVAVVVQQVAASVVLTPADVALTAANDTVRLGASAADANGHAMSGGVTWTSTSPPVATVVGGLVTAVADGTTQVVATVDAAADSVAVPVTTGAGVSRTWNGAGSADWVAPLSWTPAGRPNAMDTAMVASGTPASPALNADAAVGRVEVVSGATLDLGTHTLTVAADALAAGAITATTGKVHISNDGQIQGTLPLLEVNGLVDATAATTLIGGLRVLGGTLRTQGQRVTIQGG